MSQTTVSQVVSPMKGDIVLTRKGHRRLWDGRHWRVLCRISDCTAQRQGSLYNKFGLCKKHFTQMEFHKFKSNKSSSYESSFLSSNTKQKEQKQIVSVGKQDENNKTDKRHNLNIIVDKLRRSQTISKTCSMK
ncbi:unnamed protein product [Rotaria sp. Silwood1]|nr:unnamed protein product [Rotaria sp. Silwood1]CAF0832996.1 unnamed protein product [Rotaria sp. Silwood1]CAF0930883.1 unnamed protein product [Rotaria sp. Silwood1]CAF3365988.1 unnamed protein product [Rotaria sp. Silwood1]CAF3368331.1 unnamed protein product [Rotaria sp. Silwood1]